MGHHFVPQRHLRRFECSENPGTIWMYDKTLKKFSQVSIKNAAQAREYYHPEVEAGLAEDIEGPANLAIDKIIRGESLDNTERTRVSWYLLTMATRGPRQRRKMFEQVAPKALEEVLSELEAVIQTRIDESGGDPIAIKRMDELRAARQKFSNSLPENIVELIRTPFWSEKTIECVHNMHWRVVPALTPEFYLTCDTPTHISEWSGVCSVDSELTFPIGRDLAIIGSHSGTPATLSFMHPTTNLVREVNVRIANCSERFVFSHVKEEWIAEIADMPPEINRIQWLETN